MVYSLGVTELDMTEHSRHTHTQCTEKLTLSVQLSEISQDEYTIKSTSKSGSSTLLVLRSPS